MSEPSCLDSAYERKALMEGSGHKPVFEENIPFAQAKWNDTKGDYEEPKDLGQHYRYTYKGVKIDPYRILDVYQITHPAHQHAIKKLLRLGRSVKDTEQDLKEVIMTLERWLEMIGEDK